MIIEKKKDDASSCWREREREREVERGFEMR